VINRQPPVQPLIAKKFKVDSRRSDYVDRMTVLIADDDSLVRAALKRILFRYFRCTVLDAECGSEALNILGRARVSFAIIDIDMPGMSGTELLRAIRTSSEHASLPVAVISGCNNEETVRDVIALGVFDYFVKPLKTDKVLERLTRIVEYVARTQPVASAVARRAEDAAVPAPIGTPFDELIEIYPGLRQDLIAATEQALGMMAECEVTVPDDTASSEPALTAIEASARIDIDDRPFRVDLSFGCTEQAAAVVTSRMRGMHPSEISPDATSASLSELVTVIAGRLQKGLEERGCQARFTAAPAQAAVEEPKQNDLVLGFGSAEHEVAFTVRVRARPLGDSVIRD
jgi:DNA-binding NarL/FixJ family response regulator